MTATSPGRAASAGPDGPEDAAGPAPPVVAVVVTRNPGPFLEETLVALGGQDYPALSVLVVDAGSELDPTARVAAALPSAFVRRLGGAPGFAGAANEALAAVEGAAFFFVCHDDVALDPSAVRILVEEAYRSNAAIVGPKLVRADDPGVLLEVGRAIDRLGGSHTGIEPGEVDQEQHDAVRDVFYVASAAMLVRVDLFHELEGFDPESFPGSEDLDLCWRARLAGARVMVAPDARARHHEAAAQRQVADLPDVRAVARSRLRTILSCYSLATLLWVVPIAGTLALFEAIVFLATRRRRAALAGLGAWWWALFHLGNIRRARRHAQHGRSIHDAALHELQVGAGARFGTFLTQHHADDRLQSIGDRGRDLVDALAELLRTPAAALLLVVLGLVAFGSRDLFAQGVPAVGTIVEWPGVTDLFAELTSAWRHTGLGSAVAGPPALGVMAGLGAVLFGSVGLAETLVVVGSFLVGAVGAYRLLRAIDGSTAAAATAAIVYVVVPVPRNAIANGRLGPLVLYALLPHLVVLLVRAGRFAGTAGSARRPLVGLALGTAIVTAWYPPAALAVLVVALVLVVAALVAGGFSAALRALGAALVGVAGAAVLLAPWTVTVLDRDDLAALGIAYHANLDLAEVLRLQSGPAGGGIAPWGLLAAALVAVLVSRGDRLSWSVRALALVAVGDALVFLPAELSPTTPVAAPEAGLAIASVGVAWAAGIAISMASLAAERDTRSAGARSAADARQPELWRQFLVATAVVGVVLGSFGLAADTISGRWSAPEGSWAEVLSFAEDNRREGQFRILWIGDPDVLPLDPVELDDEVSWVITRNGAGDARELWRAPVTSADDVIGRAITVSSAGRTTRMGRLLAPAGVRYVVVPLRNGPEGARGRPIPAVTAALAGQLDLTRLRSEPGLLIFENRAWAPARALTITDVPSGAVVPLLAAVRTDLSAGAARRRRARPARDLAAGGGVRRRMVRGQRRAHARAPARVRLGERVAAPEPEHGRVRTRRPRRPLRGCRRRAHPVDRRARVVGARPGAERATRRARIRRERLEQAPRSTDFAIDSELAGFDDLDGFWEDRP